MTVKTTVLGLLGLVVMLLALVPATLWADSAVTPDFLPVNPNASGTKASGPLAIYYQATGVDCDDDPFVLNPMVNMFVALRLKVGNNVSAFALDPAPQVCYLDTNDHRDAISAFVQDTVLPAFFETFTSWDLKNVTNFRQDSNDLDAAAFWVVADIELAVK